MNMPTDSTVPLAAHDEITTPAATKSVGDLERNTQIGLSALCGGASIISKYVSKTPHILETKLETGG